jgi:hypothetical protein
MNYQTLDQLRSVAGISPDKSRPTMTRSERLARWAELLERDPERRLSTFYQTEYRPLYARKAMRSADSPISVAFSDPVLRGEGLEEDSYGEARRFFGMTDQQLHEVVCSCHSGATVTGRTAAYYVRTAMAAPRSGLFGRIADALFRGSVRY